MSMSSVGSMPASLDGFRVGNVLSRTIGVLSRHVATFVLVAAVAQLPGLILSFVGRGITVVGMSGGLTVLLLLPFTQTIIYHAAFQDMLGRPIQIGSSITVALQRFFPVLGTLICMGLLMLLGFIVLVVPGIIVATVVAVAIPVCAVERLGPFASIGRSARLTKGNRWKIFGLWLLVCLASVAIGLVGLLLRISVGGEFAVVGGFVIQSALGAFDSILLAVVYHDLRVAREGLDTDRIAAVFD